MRRDCQIQKPFPEAVSKQPGEKARRIKRILKPPRCDNGARSLKCGNQNIRVNMASGERRGQEYVNIFLEQSWGRGCCGLILQTENQPSHEGRECIPPGIAPAPEPQPTSQPCSFRCPHCLTQWFVQRKESGYSCWKMCPLVFWVDAPSPRRKKTESAYHPRALSHCHHPALQFLAG